MNELINSRSYIKALGTYMIKLKKEGKITKNSILLAVVPSSLSIRHILNTYNASKLKNYLGIVSICTKINLNNMILNDNK